MFFAPSKSRHRSKICNIGVSKTNGDLKDLDVLCTLKMKIQPKFKIWWYQRVKIQNSGLSKTTGHGFKNWRIPSFTEKKANLIQTQIWQLNFSDPIIAGLSLFLKLSKLSFSELWLSWAGLVLKVIIVKLKTSWLNACLKAFSYYLYKSS